MIWIHWKNKGILHWNLSQDINLNKESGMQKQLSNTSRKKFISKYEELKIKTDKILILGDTGIKKYICICSTVSKFQKLDLIDTRYYLRQFSVCREVWCVCVGVFVPMKAGIQLWLLCLTSNPTVFLNKISQKSGAHCIG